MSLQRDKFEIKDTYNIDMLTYVAYVDICPCYISKMDIQNKQKNSSNCSQSIFVWYFLVRNLIIFLQKVNLSYFDHSQIYHWNLQGICIRCHVNCKLKYHLMWFFLFCWYNKYSDHEMLQNQKHCTPSDEYNRPHRVNTVVLKDQTSCCTGV